MDALGNIIRDVAPDGATTTYTRDANGRVLTQTLSDPDGSGPLTAPVSTYQYDTSGNVVQLSSPGGAVRTWTYNAQNLPLTAVNELGQTTTYFWNSNRTLASQTLPNGAVTAYAYNSRGQVTSVTIPDPDGTGPLTVATIASSFDSYGRLVSRTNPTIHWIRSQRLQMNSAARRITAIRCVELRL